jgi:uncharacterized glyoxalase superfamily protein PhnB
MSNVRLLKTNPTLRAKDIKALAEWYRDAVGFEILFLWGDPTEYAMIRHGPVEFGIARQDAHFGPISAYAHLEGVDAFHAELTSRGVSASRSPTVQPYGMKDFDVTDPSGNRICFGEATGEGEEAAGNETGTL